MPRATVNSIALPNGVSATGAPRLSIFLAPQLEPDDSSRLDTSPDLLDWPAALTRPDVDYLVEFAGHDPVVAHPVSAAPRPELWTALFHPDCYVGGRSPIDHREPSFVSYPYVRIGEYIKELYQKAAIEQFHNAPSRAVVGEWLDALTDVARRGDQGPKAVDAHLTRALDAADRRAERRVETDPHGDPWAPPAIAGDDLDEGLPRDLAQFELFHHVPEGTLREMPDDAPEARRRLLDFHAALSAISDHPSLLRQLGLVVDLELDDAPPAPFGLPGRIRARPVWRGQGPDVGMINPWVAYIRFDRAFCIAGRRADGTGLGDEHLYGMIVLGNGFWDLVQLDVDGAMFKTIGVAAASDARTRAGARSESEPLAALRTAGLTLARRDAAMTVRTALATHRRRAAVDADAGEPLHAEDVTRGIRLDVFEARTGRWRTVHARRATFAIDNGPGIPAVLEEGFIRTAVRQTTANADGTPRLYVHDSMCRWDGWSLAAPHPGGALSVGPRSPTEGTSDTVPERLRNTPVPGGIPLTVTVAVEPGSLPRLRFGEDYRLRLRTVDLAGNGPSVADADEIVDSIGGLILPPTGAETFRRFEPVGSPELVARAEVQEGESLARLVIRTDLDTVDGQVCERHVVPPKTSQSVAELHGMFDAAIGTGKGVAAAYATARKEQGSLADREVLMSDGATREQAVRTLPSPAGDYLVNAENQLIVPYLPDPLASGVTLSGIPGVTPGTLLAMSEAGTTVRPAPVLPPFGAVTEGLAMVSFGDRRNWPEVAPFRLVLADGGGPPEWDPAERRLVIRLPRAGRARVSLSCYPPGDRLDDLALRAWAIERSPEDAVERDVLIASGLSWQISPARTVELVHAVQRPIRAPVLHIAVGREAGATSVLLTGDLRVHGGSTERVDLVAEWNDAIDQLDSPAPQLDVRGSAHVCEIPIHLGYDRAPTGESPPTTSGGIAYDEENDVVLLRPPAAGEGSGPQARHEFGDSRHRLVRYRAVATSRFREYFPASLAEDPENLTVPSPPAEVDVPSSARPSAPHVRYVVPTYTWQRGPTPDSLVQVVNRRRGGGLRVYLSRPWFSSGAGELLAVVLGPDAATASAALAERYVTRWGRDPLWEPAPPLAPVPTLAHFPRAVASASGLVLAELAGAAGSPRVSVAGHEVTYDPDRDLWYCDLTLEAGSAYTPFVRLALTRWQPSSLPGLELSALVMADFAQPAPDRSVTVTRSSTDGITGVDLSVAGPAPQFGPTFAPSAHGPGPMVEVSVQRRLAGTSSDLGWIDVGDDPAVRIVRDPIPPATELRWSGRVEVPEGTPGGYRVLIREYEVFRSHQRRPAFIETVML